MFIYVYSPSDFIGGLPNEAGGAASGSPTFNLQLVPGATPTLIEITDNEAVFDEIDGSQSLTNSVNIDGTAYGAGTTVHTAYDLINTGSGHKVTSIHFGGNGYEQGAVHGLVSTELLVPGVNYSFNFERSSYLQNNEYDDYVACFAEGMRIDTPTGPKLVQDLQIGDLVLTKDNGAKPVEWIGSRKVAAKAAFAPVVISAGALGNENDLVFSPEHRVLLTGAAIELAFGDVEVLVAAKHLVDHDRIYRRTGGDVRYFHVMFDAHEIVSSDGVYSESFLYSELALSGFEAEQAAEIHALFPELSIDREYVSARRCLRRHEVAIL